MTKKHLSTDDGKVYYWHHKKSPTCLVFSHGIVGDHHMFQHQVNFFREKYSILVWDQPKHGLSRPFKTFSYENNAKLLKQIIDLEGYTHVILIGLSNGGYTCQMFLDKYPDRVKGFIAIDTTPFGDYYSFRDKIVFSMFALSLKMIPEKFLRHQMALSSCLTDQAYHLMRKIQDQYQKTEIIGLAGQAYSCLMKENRKVQITCPTIILLGQHDKALKVDKYSKAWSARTGLPLKIVPNAKHFSNADNPDYVNTVISDFLENINKQ